MRVCTTCNNKIGSRKIHENLHLIFDAKPELIVETQNAIVFEYWKTFDQFGTVTLSPNEITSLQLIDREIRNIIQPSRIRKKARENEAKVRQEYSNSDNKDHIQDNLVLN